MDIGNGIAKFRMLKGMTRKELSDRAGLAGSHVSLIERGKRSPTLRTLEAIAEGLETQVIVLAFLAMSDDELEVLDEVVVLKMTNMVFKSAQGRGTK